MAPKKRTAKVAAKNDDSVVYKVMAALLIACIQSLAVQQVSKYYLMIDHMDTVRSGLLIATIVLAVLTVAAAVCMLLFRSRKALRFPLGLGALSLLTCCAASLLLYSFWTGPAMLLYFLFFAVAIIISIYLLYQPEFFLISVATIAAAFGFYCLSQLYGTNYTGLLLLVNLALAFLFVLLGVIALLAARAKGLLIFGSLRLRAYSLGTPLPMYVTSALWLLCLAAGLLLGSFFCYCCIFAAIAFEFVCAFYFTIRLK